MFKKRLQTYVFNALKHTVNKTLLVKGTADVLDS